MAQAEFLSQAETQRDGRGPSVGWKCGSLGRTAVFAFWDVPEVAQELRVTAGVARA